MLDINILKSWRKSHVYFYVSDAETFKFVQCTQKLVIYQIWYSYSHPSDFAYMKYLGEEDKKATISKQYSRELWW